MLTSYTAADALLFTAPVGGRQANDENNKRRERMVVDMLNGSATVADAAFDALKAGLAAVVLSKKEALGLAAEAPVTAVLLAGRGHHVDILLTIGTTVLKEEFKYGATNIQALPQFYNAPANKVFHAGQTYAQFFHANYLGLICALYGVEATISVEEYVGKVHANSSTHPFFRELEAAIETRGTEQLKAQKKALVDGSIREWLVAVKDTTDLGAITAAFRSTQAEKEYLLCKVGRFYTDKIDSESLTVTSVLGIHLGKYLVLQSATPGVKYYMLLRWKNDAGVLFPAWQISMKR